MSKTVPQDTAGIRSEQAGDLRRYLSVRWPRCPVFDSLRLRPYKTIPNRVGSVTRYASLQSVSLDHFDWKVSRNVE